MSITSTPFIFAKKIPALKQANHLFLPSFFRFIFHYFMQYFFFFFYSQNLFLINNIVILAWNFVAPDQLLPSWCFFPIFYYTHYLILFLLQSRSLPFTWMFTSSKSTLTVRLIERTNVSLSPLTFARIHFLHSRSSLEKKLPSIKLCHQSQTHE